MIKQITLSFAFATILIPALHSMEKEESASLPLPQEMRLDIIEKVLHAEYNSNNLFDFFKRLWALTRVSKDFSADVASQNKLFSRLFTGDRFEFACYSYLMPLLKSCLVQISRTIAIDHQPLLRIQVILIKQIGRLLLQVQADPEPSLEHARAMWEGLALPALREGSALITHLVALSVVATAPSKLANEIETALSMAKPAEELEGHGPETTTYSEQSSLGREIIPYLPIPQQHELNTGLWQKGIDMRPKDMKLTDIMLSKFGEVAAEMMTDQIPDLDHILYELVNKDTISEKYRILWQAVTKILEILLTRTVFEDYLFDTVMGIALCCAATPTAKVDIAKILLAKDLQPFFLLLPLSESLLRGNDEFSKLILKSMPKLNRQDERYLAEIVRARLDRMSDELIMLCCEALKWPPLMSELLIQCKNGDFGPRLLPSALTIRLNKFNETHVGVLIYAAIRFGHLELLKAVLRALIQQGAVSPREIIELTREASQYNHRHVTDYLASLIVPR